MVGPGVAIGATGSACTSLPPPPPHPEKRQAAINEKKGTACDVARVELGEAIVTMFTVFTKTACHDALTPTILPEDNKYVAVIQRYFLILWNT